MRKHPDVIRDPEQYERGWTGGLPETPCGSGSKLSNTVKQRQWLADVVSRYDISSVVDVGAGDLNWIGKVGWDVDYTPLDLVPRHPDVRKFDIVAEVPPAADAVMMLWVLNHFPEDNARAALDNVRASGATWFIHTWDSRLWPFLDLEVTEQTQICPPKPDKPHAIGHDGVFVRLSRL